MSFINQLKHQLNQPLPGPEAQYKMAHAVRHSYPPPPPTATIACVLALLYPKELDWHTVLIQRIVNDRHDRHSGQISFPGGRYETSDGSYENGALREAEEEVGLDPQQVEIIGQLTDLYIPVSNFLVYPFVGISQQEQQFVPQPTEVQGILEVPIPHLLHKETIQTTNLRLSNQLTLQNVPFYNVQGKIVWGATAMMLSELLEILEKVQVKRA